MGVALQALCFQLDMCNTPSSPLSHAHVIASSGEPLTWTLARRLLALVPPSCALLNIYGSTEVGLCGVEGCHRCMKRVHCRIAFTHATLRCRYPRTALRLTFLA